MRGMLSFHLLWLLRKGESCGDDLAKELETRRGERPNPGTIYPALKNLANAGLIDSEKRNRKVFYKLTYDGRMELDLATEYFKQVFGEIIDPTLGPGEVVAEKDSKTEVVEEKTIIEPAAEEPAAEAPKNEFPEVAPDVGEPEPAVESAAEEPEEAAEPQVEEEAPDIPEETEEPEEEAVTESEEVRKREEDDLDIDYI